MKTEYKDLNEIVQAISQENRALREELLRVKHALAWYASVNNWRSMAIHSDKGGMARKTLNYGQPEF